MNALILAAGFATRLLPLTLNTAKPLLDVGGKSILERIVDCISGLEHIHRIAVITNGRFHADFEIWKKEYKRHQEIAVEIDIISDETMTNNTRLGPLADIALAFNSIQSDEDLLIVAGDNLFECDLRVLQETKKTFDASVIGIYDIGDREKSRNKFGNVVVDETMRVIHFEEKPETPRSSLTATALYILRREDLSLVSSFCRASVGNQTNLGDLMVWLLRNRRPLFACTIPVWFDIGSPEDLALARNYYRQF
jgi:glucose-1-phosphate thymidylyltransferase